METISLPSPVLHPLKPFPAKPRYRKTGTVEHEKKKKKPIKVLAGKRDAYNREYNGRLVDENMIVLRKRILEIKMVEQKHEPPSDWMEWEKRYYADYNSDICEAMGLLQTKLMNTRPSLALGTMGLLILSVPISTVVTLSHLIEITKLILYSIHLS
ncbi:PREDICTED: uncharacterized protein LOC104587761 [Nelumbo nucifera]|uniref:Uncharacterized protein LOC104587761 n=2 Tax=Nelumbo nucifera TaxID=4432 RepID=A0A1U7Z9J4_NELNU|nr:PREDICTED: uncharacterized protein LOC104587761 [Nelumbo nucifera]DAD31977.1 TPA_asm: hypothetical protein HUJ06_010828 [Nelumbo nucifera]